MREDILQALQWRYAVKMFDPKKKIAQEDLQVILESGRLAPSSLGVQPWTFVLVEKPASRKTLRSYSWDQGQITDASHLLLICRKTELNEAYVDQVMQKTADLRNVAVSTLAGLKEMIMGKLTHTPQKELAHWSALQCYLALGMILESAALLKVDACPMEGFDAAKYDEALGLAEKGLSTVVVCALGYRSEEDKYAHAAKARLDASDVIVRL